MSISKKKGKKIVTRQKHYSAIQKVKKKIKILYGINIKNVYFSYIFNYDEINEDDIIECNMQSLDYFYYSIDLGTFLQTAQKQNAKKKDIFVEREKNNCISVTNLTFNSLSNMREIKINTKFIKSKENCKNEYGLLFTLLNRKRNYECTSDILDDLKPVKLCIHKNKNLKLEISEEKGSLKQILPYLNDSEYVCLIECENNIYVIYNKTTFLYDSVGKTFMVAVDKLGTKLLINDINVKYEIFSIV